MTLWARKSDFEAAFDSIAGEWEVEVVENSDNTVEFFVQPLSSARINMESFSSSHAMSQMTACGAESVELEISNTPKFRIRVEKSNLPDDYDT